MGGLLERQVMLAIIVTYGTRPRTVYARDISTMSDARRMQGTARDYGYGDAQIVDQDAFERQQAEAKKARDA